ncbi:variable charge X-linked protein 3-like [Symphalangus syndactylus]|uniref:variable charge X-linked protein 3-like n=1 Tax=Symphalangus syndactylus TaxID=9590 RepID=UPI0030072ABE
MTKLYYLTGEGGPCCCCALLLEAWNECKVAGLICKGDRNQETSGLPAEIFVLIFINVIYNQLAELVEDGWKAESLPTAGPPASTKRTRKRKSSSQLRPRSPKKCPKIPKKGKATHRGRARKKSAPKKTAAVRTPEDGSGPAPSGPSVPLNQELPQHELQPEAPSEGTQPEEKLSKGTQPEEQVNEGTQPDPLSEGTQAEEQSEGTQPDPLSEGTQAEEQSEGTQPDSLSEGTQPDPLSEGTQAEKQSEGTQPDSLSEGTQPDPLSEGTQPDPLSEGTATNSILSLSSE